MRTSSLLAQARALDGQGRRDEALALLRDALRRGLFSPEELQAAGRFLKDKLSPGEAAASVSLVGQVTTAWLAMALSAVGWARGLPLLVEEGEYDNVLASVERAAASGSPRIVVLVPSSERILETDASSLATRVETELALFRRAWEVARERGARIVQVGYAAPRAGPLGAHLGSGKGGHVSALRDASAALREGLPRGAYFVDLELVSGSIGREAFHDARRWFWTKQPFSERGTALLAEHLVAGIRALVVGPKKVLVLDLDDTLWGGVVGEVGPHGIALGEGPDGEAFLAFQRHLKALAGRGVLLAISSKNNPEDAREAFEKNRSMALRLDDFAALEIGWDAKSAAIQRIASTLDLGLESFVFFDDNPAEREEVRRALPAVEVANVPADPADYVRALEDGLWFESVELTSADRERSEQYRVERSRREHRATCSSPEDYFRSLEMKGEARALDEADLERATQLIAKTNQWNLTTRRHSRDEVARLAALPGAIALTLRVEDRFGDHGLVSVLLAVPEAGGVRIDTWLMSCRVIGRTAERFLFARFLERCRELGHEKIWGELIPTKKNAVVETLYPSLGFAPAGVVSGVQRFELETGKAALPPTFISAFAAGERGR